VKGDAEQFVLENGFGVAVTPSNPAKMAEAVRGFYSVSPEERKEMGRAGLVAYQTKYSSSIQIARVEEVLATVVSRGKRRNSYDA